MSTERVGRIWKVVDQLAERIVGLVPFAAIGVEGYTIIVWLYMIREDKMAFQRLSHQIPSIFEGFPVKVRLAKEDEFDELAETIKP